MPDRVTWAQVGNAAALPARARPAARRIVDSVLRRVGVEVAPLMETDSMRALIAHVRTGRWASIVPSSALESIE